MTKSDLTDRSGCSADSCPHRETHLRLTLACPIAAMRVIILARRPARQGRNARSPGPAHLSRCGDGRPLPRTLLTARHRRLPRGRSHNHLLCRAPAADAGRRPARAGHQRPVTRNTAAGRPRAGRRHAPVRRVGPVRLSPRRAARLRRLQRTVRLDVCKRVLPSLPRVQPLRPQRARHQGVLCRPHGRAVVRDIPEAYRSPVRRSASPQPQRIGGCRRPGGADACPALRATPGGNRSLPPGHGDNR